MQLWANFAVCWIYSGQTLLQKYETVMMSLLVKCANMDSRNVDIEPASLRCFDALQNTM